MERYCADDSLQILGWQSAWAAYELQCAALAYHLQPGSGLS